MKFTWVENDQKVNADYELRFVLNDKIENCPDRETLEMLGFKKGSVCDLPEARRVYVSLKDTSPETLRLGIAKVMNALKGHKVKSIQMQRLISSAAQGGTGAALKEMQNALSAVAEGFTLAAYNYDKYKSEANKSEVKEVFLSVTGCDKETAEAALKRGTIIAEATNYTRDIVNEMPQVYTPEMMAADSEKLAENYYSVKCEVFGKDYLKEQGMNAFLAVNQGSPNEPRLIHLYYRPGGRYQGKICFVGKGLTYDTGGLSLKPGQSMYHMKSDKAGAAACMGIIKAAAELELPFEVHAVLGATENAIGGKSYKPDDVLKARNGVTIEVNNTDAEGRLVLADCLSWAQDMVQPDMLVDLATLTGACVVGLGDYTSGIIGNNYDLQMDFKKGSMLSGENYTILEFNDHMRPLIDSDVADVKNSVPGGMGGAITAGLFLDRFIKDEYKDKWLHLDIAGPAFGSKAWGYNPVGASGAGVRGCTYFMLSKEI
ncbi:MAG: leucyl aminopeptidase [Firmicutes bacterium]|nr:leucyl aminopeptidase [Bacillota bacterium]